MVTEDGYDEHDRYRRHDDNSWWWCDSFLLWGCSLKKLKGGIYESVGWWG